MHRAVLDAEQRLVCIFELKRSVPARIGISAARARDNVGQEALGGAIELR